MSVKYALLALLSRQPATTYQLKKDFDDSTSHSWPLNIGQVSTTLQRLQRDALVVRDDLPAPDREGHGRWRLTQAGGADLAAWWQDPVVPAQRGRDELVIKLALAVAVGDIDVASVVQRQRSATQRSLHDLTRLRRGVAAVDVAGRLILDNHLFLTEAELRWLDDVEEALVRQSVATRGSEKQTAPEAAAELAQVERSAR